MRRIYVVTHPEATHHVDGLVGGWFDSELTDRGHEHARAVARRLRELVPVDASVAVHSSDLRRCVQTATPIAEALGAESVLLAGLREKSYGVAGGRPQVWLDERFVLPPAAGERLDHDEGVAGAETKREWVQRVYLAMQGIVASEAEHVVVVTHGGCVSWVVGAWIGLPVEATGFAAFRSPSGGLTVLEEDDRFHNRAVVLLGDTAHLGPARIVP